ncbi:hypothetical protein LCGC14_1106010 [marine sediment metagenome]|uniref:Uncharacterized protein n=1 Tax=marine sediment metagenome TaxID=412755 RepID=A0A0F9QED8_9ZZZZ
MEQKHGRQGNIWELMEWAAIVVLSFSWALGITWLWVIMNAMIRGDGVFTMRFNDYGEGWPEVGIIWLLTLAHPVAVLILVRKLWRT